MEVMEYIRLWHGDHSPEYLKEEDIGAEECDVYYALQEYDKNPSEEAKAKVIAVFKETDSEGYDNIIGLKE